jgi:FkbM family methyltransferase
MRLSDYKTDYKNGKMDKWSYIEKMYNLYSVLFDYADFIKDTEINKIEIENGEVVMTFKSSNIKFQCTNNDKRLAPFDALNFASYEADELDMQLELINPNSTILDIGGNYGWYALHVAKKYPNAKIFSFEPIPNTFLHLNKNISLNGLSNIQTYNFGLSDEEGEFLFYYDPELSVNASLQNVSAKDSIITVKCSVNTLDNFWKGSKSPIDFIKCDVEGVELLAFKGGLETIRKDLPIIFTEMLRKWTSKFNYHPNDIIELLSDIGYGCYVLSDKRLKCFFKVD